MTPRQAATKIVTILRDHGHHALLAGGCVRDILLGTDPKDFDVATDAPPDRVARIFHSTKLVGVQFGVVIVRLGGCETEVATFRSDGDYQDGRRPESVQFASAEQDALRRDFTINGMFLDPVANQVIDYVEGRKDLNARVIRCIGDPHRRFTEDHLRMLRAVRFAARLGFTIADDTFGAIQQNVVTIARISAERIRMELELILAHPSRSTGWRLIVESSLLNHLSTAVSWSIDDAARIGAILARLPDHAPLPASIAAMLIQMQPRHAADACRVMRFSNQMSAAVQAILEWTRRLITANALELADLKILRASPNYQATRLLSSAAIDADNQPRQAFESTIQAADAIESERIAPPPLIRGEDLMTLGVSPGPRLGDILEWVYRAQLNETVIDRDAAMNLARELAARSI